MNFSPPYLEITEDRAETAADTLKAMIDEGHPQSAQLKIGLFAICTYVKIIRLLSQRGMSVQILRRLLGIDVKEEEDVKKNPKPKELKPKSLRKSGKHGKRPAKTFLDAVHRFFAHPDFSDPGTICPECEGGGMYPNYYPHLLEKTIVKSKIYQKANIKHQISKIKSDSKKCRNLTKIFRFLILYCPICYLHFAI